jgi:hypothetical protein
VRKQGLEKERGESREGKEKEEKKRSNPRLGTSMSRRW